MKSYMMHSANTFSSPYTTENGNSTVTYCSSMSDTFSSDIKTKSSQQQYRHNKFQQKYLLQEHSLIHLPSLAEPWLHPSWCTLTECSCHVRIQVEFLHSLVTPSGFENYPGGCIRGYRNYRGIRVGERTCLRSKERGDTHTASPSPSDLPTMYCCKEPAVKQGIWHRHGVE